MNIQNKAIQEIITRIAKEFNPIRIYLFGSYGKGEANTDSDVDLLIEFNQVDDKRKTAIEIRNGRSIVRQSVRGKYSMTEWSVETRYPAF